jgi:hypothetical protein
MFIHLSVTCISDQIGIEVLYKKLLSKHECQENWLTVILYLRAKINFYTYFPYFLTNLEQIWCRDIHMNLLSNYEFNENQYSEGYTPHTGQK